MKERKERQKILQTSTIYGEIKIQFIILILELEKSNPSEEVHGKNAADMLIDYIFSGSFWYMILMLGITIQVAGTIALLYSFGSAAALTPLIGSVIVPLIQQMIFGVLIQGIIALGSVAGFAALMYYLYPNDDPVWKEGFGLSLLAAGISFTNILLKGQFGGKMGIEIVGLFASIVGLMIALSATGKIAVLGALLCSGAGILITILNKAPNDYNPLDPFRNIEELFSIISLSSAILNAIRFGFEGE